MFDYLTHNIFYTFLSFPFTANNFDNNCDCDDDDAFAFAFAFFNLSLPSDFFFF